MSRLAELARDVFRRAEDGPSTHSGDARNRAARTAPAMPFCDLWRRLLHAEHGVQRGEALLSAILCEYRELCRAHGDVRERVLRRHLLGNILPQLAAYRTFCRDEDGPVALSRVRSLHFATLERVKRRHERASSIPGVFGFYRLLVPRMLRTQHPPSGWQIEWVENSGRCIYARVRQCFYQDTLEALGARDLIHVYCAGDDFVFGEVESKRIAWTRSKTRPRGDEYCDIRYEPPARGGNTR